MALYLPPKYDDGMKKFIKTLINTFSKTKFEMALDTFADALKLISEEDSDSLAPLEETVDLDQQTQLLSDDSSNEEIIQYLMNVYPLKAWVTFFGKMEQVKYE